MPSTYDLPEFTGWYDQQDVNLYNKLPFYLASMQAKRQGMWMTYGKLYGKIPWQANMGATMKAVEATYSPIGRSEFFPNAITSLPNKDVFEHQERTEQAVVTMHDFFSKNITFLPSFQDFRTNQVDFENDNIMRQIGYADDLQLRTVIYHKSPLCYIVGNTNDAAAVTGGLATGNLELVSAPVVPAALAFTSANVDAAGKKAAWRQLMAANVAGAPGIRLKTIKRLVMTMRDYVGADFFEGTLNTPKDNAVVKGKYVLTGDQSIYDNMVFDPDLVNLRDVHQNLAEDGFQMTPFSQLTFKAERYPLHMAADGTFPVPEIVTDSGDVVPNPAYCSADFSWAFLHGADGYKSIKIGPPPKPFAGGEMDLKTFQGMSWNGEVRLSRNIMLKSADGTYDNNSMGRFVRLQAALTMGTLPVRPRNVIPILFRRTMPDKQ